MKVAIITMHAARNYGVAPQNYIETHGNECVIMDYQLPNQSTRGYLLNINGKFRKNAVTKLAYLMKTFLPKCLTTKLFHAFLNRQLHLSRPVRVRNGRPEDVPEADVYCAGSDQIWNPRANGGFHPMYFLEGINGKKISYASSIGIDRFTEDEKTAVQGYLQGFEHISVRELSGVPMLEELGYHADCVLDPTLLLEQKDWMEFAGEKISGEPYLLVYFFGNAKVVMNTATEIAKKRGLKIRRIAVGFEKYSTDQIVERFISPEHFVALFLNASYVITNSFHGTVFSVNFKKQLLVYPTTERNARFESVFRMFGLEGRNLRALDDEQVLNLHDVDYSAVFEKLEEMRKRSGVWLNNALHG